jgi:hypothetical protein
VRGARRPMILSLPACIRTCINTARHGVCEWPYGEKVHNGEITTWGLSTVGRGMATNSPLKPLLLALPLHRFRHIQGSSLTHLEGD